MLTIFPFFSTATARGSDYQTDSGIAFLESGSISASRNTGSETINAGDLVILDLPPTNLQLTGSGSMFMSPNNPNGGMPIGKYVMVTRPYHAEDQVGHLCTISALLRRSRTQQVQPGILGYSFNEIHYQHESGRPGNSILSDASLETAWTFQYAWGLWFAMFEEMLANDVIKSIVERAANAANNTDAKRHAACVELFETLMVTRLDESTATTNPSFKIFDYVMQHHNARTNHRKKAMQDFERRNAAALDNKTKQVLRDDKDLNHHYAQLTRAPLQGLYAAFARSAAFNDAWIIGRAINTALPGETLDLLVACRTRPSNR